MHFGKNERSHSLENSYGNTVQAVNVVDQCNRFDNLYDLARYQATKTYKRLFTPIAFARPPFIDTAGVHAALQAAITNGLLFYFPLDKQLILVPAPKIALNEQGQFHSTVWPAIDWQHREKLYLLAGVLFPKKLWEELCVSRSFSKTLLEIGNIEQRRVALQMLGGRGALQHMGSS